MNCTQFRDEMALYVGQEQLPEEFRAHLNGCEACRKAWGELLLAASHLGNDSLFAVDKSEQDEMVARIEERIGVTRITDIRPRRWIQYAAAVAAVLLLGLIAILSALNYSDMAPTVPSAGVDTSDSAVYSITDAAYDLGTADESLDDDAVGALMYDLVSQNGQQASDTLLNGLSEDELKYLEANLKVGDLL
ncbi:MAG: hypothetical protein AB1644_13200 [Candidatus Zixiibacteriota bacterium]